MQRSRLATILALVFVSAAPANGTFAATATNWDPYLAKLTAADKACKGAIFGLDGTQWAGQAGGLTISKAEIQPIIAGFGSPRSLMASGPTINGVKYMTTQADGSSVVLKNGQKGAIFVKSKQVVSACLFSEADTTPSQAKIATESFRAYLQGIGF